MCGRLERQYEVLELKQSSVAVFKTIRLREKNKGWIEQRKNSGKE